MLTIKVGLDGKLVAFLFNFRDAAVERGKVCHERQIGPSLRRICATIDR